MSSVSSSSRSFCSVPSPAGVRLLHRLLIDYDVSVANRLLQSEVLDLLSRKMLQGKAEGVPDLFIYNCQQALQDDYRKYEYKIANLLLWALMYEPFKARLLENEPFKDRLDKKMNELFMRFVRGMRLDGRQFEIGAADKHIDTPSHVKEAHLRATGWLIHTIRNMYLDTS